MSGVDEPGFYRPKHELGAGSPRRMVVRLLAHRAHDGYRSGRGLAFPFPVLRPVRFARMSTFADLDALSSDALHDRAVALARRRLDVRFFWRLFESIPEARALAGQVGEMEADVQHAWSWLSDFRRSGGRLDEALRPIYIDYLLEHERPAAHS